MSRIIIIFTFVAVLAISSAFNIHEIEESHVVDDLDAFKAKNPNVEIVSLTKEHQPFGPPRYAIGQRSPGDGLLGQGSKSYTFTSAKNIRLKLSYPSTSKTLTYVLIWVDQSSDVGRVYVIDGGIGQKRISVIVEAKFTWYFSYKISIYGR